MHSTKRTKTVIGTQKSVYRDSSAGKLERSSLVRDMLIPHHQGFNSDSKARLPIAVHHLSTFYALKDSVVATMPAFSHSTAVGTPFTGAVGINNVEFDVFVEAPAFECCFEQERRNPQDLFVKLPTFGFEPSEVFNGDVGITFKCDVGNISNNLTDSVFDEVLLFSLKSNQALFGPVASFVCETLQPLSPFKYSLTFNPDVFSEISLLEDFPLWSENRNSKAFAVDINPDHIPSGGDFSFFREVSNYLTIAGKPISLACPTTLNQGAVSLKVPVVANGDCYLIPRIQSKFHEGSALGLEGFTVSGNIELDSNCLKGRAFTSDNTPFDVTDYLAVKGGGFLAS